MPAIEFIEREDIRTMMSYSSEREQAIIIILYTTAMRANELENLQVEDITPTKTYIRKRQEYKPKTRASATFIPHGDVTWQAYQWLIANNPPGNYILQGTSVLTSLTYGS